MNVFRWALFDASWAQFYWFLAAYSAFLFVCPMLVARWLWRFYK